MQRAHVSEADARALVRSHALAKSRPPNTIVEEFWLPLSNRRADLALVGPLLEGVEVKTHHDSLKRLPGQAAAYGSVFDARLSRLSGIWPQRRSYSLDGGGLSESRLNAAGRLKLSGLPTGILRWTHPSWYVFSGRRRRGARC